MFGEFSDSFVKFTLECCGTGAIPFSRGVWGSSESFRLRYLRFISVNLRMKSETWGLMGGTQVLPAPCSLALSFVLQEWENFLLFIILLCLGC